MFNVLKLVVMESLEAYLKEKEGSRGIKIFYIDSTIIPNAYLLSYEVIRKDDSFSRGGEVVTVLELMDFVYSKILDL